MPGQQTKAPLPKSKKKKVSVSNQARLDANTPIPFEHGGKVFSFVNQTSYIPFLPPLDTYAQLLLETRLTSVTHNACVTTKKDYCAGEGFHDVNAKEFPEEITDWFGSMNLRNQSATRLNKRIFEDFFTYGNVPVEVVRFSVGSEKFLYVYVHNFLEWRLCTPDEDDIVTHAVQSKLFLRKGYVTADELKKARVLPIYNPKRAEKDNWFKDEKGSERTLFWYKNEVTGFDHYGLPSAVAAMIYEILEYKGARYNLDNFENNMVIGALLALKGNLGQEEANRIGRQIINTHTGDGKRGRVAIVASEEGIDGSELHNLDTTKDGSYTKSDDKWMQKIILANEWDAILAGLISPSTLGKGSGFLTKIMEIKLNSVIRPAQNDLMTELWIHIFKIAKEWMGLPLDEFKIAIKNSIDISGLTDVDITPAVQVNEVRKAKSLPEDPNKIGVYMTEAKTNQEKGGDNVQP